jgi:membrane protein DedA with SNARE-associated domain
MTDVVMRLGPLGVFLLMVPESACLPIPSEVTCGAAGFSVSQDLMPFWAAVLAATAGNLVGSLLAYWLGHATGGPRREGLLAAALARTDPLFERFGRRAVFVARLLPLARTFISLPAGHARIPLGRFVAMTLAGCAIWAAGFTVVGMVAGSGWKQVSGTVGTVLLIATALGVLGALALRRFRSR